MSDLQTELLSHEAESPGERNSLTDLSSAQESCYTGAAQLAGLDTHPVITKILTTCSLTEVHPNFNCDNWPRLEIEDQMRIAPALVLATYMLRSDPALHFFHAFYFGPRAVAIDLNGHQRTRFHCTYRNDQPLPTDEAAKVHTQLEELAGSIKFSFANIVEYGRCDSDPCFGASHITLARTCLEALDCANVPGPVLLTRWVDMAMAFIHEVSHALSAARNPGDDNNEEFFGPDNFIEMGFAIQKALIGGNFCFRDPFFSAVANGGVVKMDMLPSSLQHRAYVDYGHDALPLSSPIPDEMDLHRLVPLEWIEQLFLQEFWEETMPATCGAALRPPTMACDCPNCANLQSSLVRSRSWTGAGEDSNTPIANMA